MVTPNIAFALGLAQKAGKLASGDFAIKSALKSKKVKLLIIAEDTAENAKKDLYYIAECVNVPVIELGTGDALGNAIGKGKRKAIGILDAGFVKMLEKHVKINIK